MDPFVERSLDEVARQLEWVKTVVPIERTLETLHEEGWEARMSARAKERGWGGGERSMLVYERKPNLLQLKKRQEMLQKILDSYEKYGDKITGTLSNSVCPPKRVAPHSTGDGVSLYKIFGDNDGSS